MLLLGWPSSHSWRWRSAHCLGVPWSLGRQPRALRVLEHMLVAATLAEEALGFWVVAAAWAAAPQGRRAFAILLGPVVQQHILQGSTQQRELIVLNYSFWHS